MAIRVIVKDPDPVLRQKAKKVTKITPNLHKLMDDMVETMQDANGVGLAANQVGILKRMTVIDVGDGVIELINPEILDRKGEQLGPEGCLSFPGLLADVRRAEWCKVKAMDRHGEEFTMEGEGLLARALQHEIDHLDGIVFTQWAERFYRPEELEQN